MSRRAGLHRIGGIHLSCNLDKLRASHFLSGRAGGVS
jgi:hypothetical protein